MNLRIPGPIPVPEDILEAMSTPMINHRGTEFKDMLFRTTEGLKSVFGTKFCIYFNWIWYRCYGNCDSKHFVQGG